MNCNFFLQTTRKDQILIDKTVLIYCKRRHTNLAMAWVDNKKAYNMIDTSFMDIRMHGTIWSDRKY